MEPEVLSPCFLQQGLCTVTANCNVTRIPLAHLAERLKMESGSGWSNLSGQRTV